MGFSIIGYTSGRRGRDSNLKQHSMLQCNGQGALKTHYKVLYERKKKEKRERILKLNNEVFIQLTGVTVVPERSA